MKQHTSTSSNTEIEHKKWFLKHYVLQERSNATLYKDGYYEMMKKYVSSINTVYKYYDKRVLRNSISFRMVIFVDHISNKKNKKNIND